MDTLAQHNLRPVKTCIDMSGADLQYVAGGYQQARDTLKARDKKIMSNPERDALWFYTQQHALSLISRAVDKDEPLGKFEKFVTRYHSDTQLKALRMFYYLLLICTRESRHARTTNGHLDTLLEKHPGIAEFYRIHVRGVEKMTVADNIVKCAPMVTLGRFTNFLVDAFEIPHYQDGFGGEAWADIAHPLNDFVHGKISAEILLDTAFTLAHNNGPIFNKGMLYNNYSDLSKILDVQRSGQIPQLVANHYNEYSKHVDGNLRTYVDKFAKLHDGFDGPVDWRQVKDIYGDAIYGEDIDKQKVAESLKVSPLQAMKQKAEVKAAKAEATAAAESLAQDLGDKMKNSLEIMPGVFIPLSKRSQS